MSKSPSVLSYAPADRLSSSEHFDLVPIQQTLNRIAHRPMTAARCEALVWAAAIFIKKVEMRERAWNR